MESRSTSEPSLIRFSHVQLNYAAISWPEDTHCPNTDATEGTGTGRALRWSFLFLSNFLIQVKKKKKKDQLFCVFFFTQKQIGAIYSSTISQALNAVCHVRPVPGAGAQSETDGQAYCVRFWVKWSLSTRSEWQVLCTANPINITHLPTVQYVLV